MSSLITKQHISIVIATGLLATALLALVALGRAVEMLDHQED